MILKYKTTVKDKNREQWNYIDGIISASTYYDEEHRATVVAITKEDKSTCAIAVYEETFLLNEHGKTIEKVRA